MEQYNLYTTTKNQLDLANQQLAQKSSLSMKLLLLSQSIEKHTDVLWLWSNIVLTVLPKLIHFYVTTLALSPQTVSGSYQWLMQQAGLAVSKESKDSKHATVTVQHHRGIKKCFCQGITTFCNRIAGASAASKNKAAAANQATGGEEEQFFIEDNNETAGPLSLLSPVMLSSCNDLLLILLQKMSPPSTTTKNHTADGNNLVIHPEEINVLVCACIAHKESKPRHQCVHLLMALWQHPNSSVRHAALKGMDALCRMKLPEVIALSRSSGNGGGGGGSSGAPTSTFVVKINQRLQERDCDDEDRQLLNVLLAWFYSNMST